LLVNIHTHHHALNNSQWVIQNLFERFEEVKNIGNYSIGLHPWYLKQGKWTEEFEILKKYADSNFVLAIGECGLDKSCTTDFLLQKEVFSAHIILANEIKKPLIIHCVNAYTEIVQVLKINRNNVPVIFHGFNKKEHIALSLIKEGFFLSFGKALLNEKIQKLLIKLPVENIFFETDDDTITIEETYTTAEKILSIEAEVLQLQIKKNAIKLFGNGLL